MSTKKGKPCTKKKPCPGMAYALDRVVSDRTRIGFDFINTMDLNTGRFTPRGYAYRKTNKAPPLMLAMCPWCGVKTKDLWPDEPKEKKRGS